MKKSRGPHQKAKRRRPLLPISVIIASRGRPQMLMESIFSLLEASALPAELMVVDQSNHPHPVLGQSESFMPAGVHLTYRWSESRGLSRANNLGSQLAQQEWLAFTHDDVFLDAGWLEALYATLLAGQPDTVVTGRILPGPQEVAGGFAPTLRTGTEPVSYRGRLDYDVLKPLNMALSRAALSRVGGFDERLGPGTPFPGAEDADLGFRLLEAGFTITFVPKALIYHRSWRPAREYLPLRWRYGVAQGAFYSKHLRRHRAYILRRLFWDTKRRARRFPRRLLQERSRALGDPLFLAGNLVGALYWRLASRSGPGVAAPPLAGKEQLEEGV